MPALRRAAWWLALILGIPSGAASAQDVPPAMESCAGRIVSAIVVTPRAPSFLALPRRLRPLARGAGLHHTTTRPDVVRRFLRLRAGEPCTERRRAESERVLRVQPFLAAATVRAVAEPDGRTRIEVEAVDEIPTQAAVRPGRRRRRGGRGRDRPATARDGR